MKTTKPNVIATLHSAAANENIVIIFLVVNVCEDFANLISEIYCQVNDKI
jgi:hypothetical protein